LQPNKINSLIALTKGNSQGLFFFAEWDHPRDSTRPPALILSILNLSTFQSTFTKHPLPWSEQEITLTPKLIRDLQEAAFNEDKPIADKKMRTYLEHLKKSYHYSLRWLAQKEKNYQTNTFPTTYLFFSPGINSPNEHSLSYDQSLAQGLKDLIPQIAHAVLSNPFSYKKQVRFDNDQTLEIHFEAAGIVNELTLSIGNTRQKTRYYDQIHQPNFDQLISAQLLMLLAKKNSNPLQ
jgi:hypothetical protein